MGLVRKRTRAAGAAASAMAACFAQPASAQDRTAATEATDDQVITVTGWRLRELDVATETGSRLGLSLHDTPATVDRIDAGEILTRGFRTVEEATVSLPGVISGGSPGDPSQFSMRGFSGEQITLLHNGLYLGPANMINRPGNTFNIEGIEVLKGPASLLYGQGTVGGAVNVINKRPALGENAFQALASYGTFDTLSTGIGGNLVLSPSAAGRLDVSYHRTSGYVDRSPSKSLNVSGALLIEPVDQLSIELSLDVLSDDLSPYFGTPLVPASEARSPLKGTVSGSLGVVVDEAMRFRSYNVADNEATSWQAWPRLVVDWQASDSVTLRNTAYWFHADRRWVNAETYAFNPATRQIDRDRFFVFHNQDLAGNQLSLTSDHTIGRLGNRLVVGLDYSHLDFIRSRGFPDGDSVDPYSPVPGQFGPFVKRVSPTRWDQAALLAEDVLSLTDRLKLVTGLRAERLWLTRENYNADGSFNAGNSFTRTHKPFSWRAGLVYEFSNDVSTYASYSTGTDPVGNNIFLVNAGENFGLSDSRQFEVGLKAGLPGGRGSLTAAVYDIERDNILTLVGVDMLSNIGSQSSRGFELSGEFRVTPDWLLIGSAAFVDAQYGDFVDPNFGIDATGNRPANVPQWVGNVWTSLRNVGGLPLEIGGGVKYVGRRYGNSANTLELDPYATGIVYATWELSPRLSFTGRVNNVWDKAFVQWADIYYPTQVSLGEPRRFEVSALARF